MIPIFLQRYETSDESPRSGQAVNTQPNTRPKTTSVRRFTRKRPTVSLVGDSFIKGIRKQEINRSVRHMNTFVKTFPGATTDDMESYIIRTLKREPDYLIIHCGTNDLRRDEPEVIVKKITKLAINSKKTIRNVAVSSILARGDSDLMEGKRLQVNSILEESLAGDQISFIRHETLDQNWQYLLFEDGIHLNNEGTNVLGSSFVNYLNAIGLCERISYPSISNSLNEGDEIVSQDNTLFSEILMSDTLTCPSDLGISPDSSEKSHNDEHLIGITPTFGSISPPLPEGRSSVQVFSPSSPSNLRATFFFCIFIRIHATEYFK